MVGWSVCNIFNGQGMEHKRSILPFTKGFYGFMVDRQLDTIWLFVPTTCKFRIGKSKGVTPELSPMFYINFTSSLSHCM